jgi:hypothetical protein
MPDAVNRRRSSRPNAALRVIARTLPGSIAV